MRYHCIFVLSILATSLLGSFAKSLSPPWNDTHTKHSWDAVPKNWESLGRPPSGTTINLYIALKSRRENALVDTLYKVSKPGHPRYGAHLTKEQVAELIAPRSETLELVNSWLEHHGISSSSVSMTHGGNTLVLKGVSVTQANALLGASYQLYRHVERGETVVRTVGYSLPGALHRHVLTVAPTTSFVSSPRRARWQAPRNHSGEVISGLVESTSGEPATMLSSREKKVNYVTPAFLQSLYDTAAYTPNTQGENVLGIVGMLGDYPSEEDLGMFMSKYCTLLDDATYKVVEVNDGGYDPTHPHEEANMDIQYAAAMAYPTPIIFYSTGMGPDEDYYISWLEYILAQEFIPQTISISYGIEEKYISREYAIWVCDQFAKLGARGVSVLVSSGNDGIGDGNCLSKYGLRFEPRFPATCPYVTVVGGTTGFDPEVAAEFSGGGFSDYFERPPFQKEVVPAFLNSLGGPVSRLLQVRSLLASGRGIPDVAAQADKFRIFFKGNEQVEGGTSVAAPVMAGVISLLNDWRVLTGQDPLGFLNPWLYERGFEGLTDITEGSNPGCNLDGFSAIVGWDPVTGLGTPSFRSMFDQLP
ncbi:subtilisin-like protein [Lactarius indigo]|nr:subtilisin-like protein [Lactarius indigo]